MKFLFTLFALTLSFTAFSQSEEMLRELDIEKYAPCECFVKKKGFDREERLAQIKALEGQEVSVFYLKGKSGKIELNYVGIVDITLIKESGLPIKNLTDVIGVMANTGGHALTKYPKTNDKKHRIYLTSCFKDLLVE